MGAVDAAAISISALRAALGAALGPALGEALGAPLGDKLGTTLGDALAPLAVPLKEVPMAFQTETQVVHQKEIPMAFRTAPRKGTATETHLLSSTISRCAWESCIYSAIVPLPTKKVTDASVTRSSLFVSSKGVLASTLTISDSVMDATSDVVNNCSRS
jgi:hypothetical protein